MKKMMKIVVVGCALFLVGMQAVQAQREGDLMLSLNYQAGLPLGSFKNTMVDKSSWLGYGGDVMYHVNDHWGVGLAMAYQSYYEKTPRKVYNIGNTAQSMVLSNSVGISPILLKARYYPLGKTNSYVQPYLSAGAGLGVVDFEQYQGMYGSSQTTGRFMAQGGLGLNIPFGKLTSAGFHIGADYNYVNYNSTFYGASGQADVKVKALNSVSIYAGVHFPLR